MKQKVKQWPGITLHPLAYPVLFFGLTILTGSVLLHLKAAASGPPVAWVDALFTATSATCVTGLAVMDTGTCFSRFGQWIILVLIQIGGLGIMTLASLALYLIRQRVSLTDRIAVGQNLLHDTSFQLGRFLVAIVLLTVTVEAAGAAMLFYLTDESLFSATFHSISAFCNGGFSLYSDSLSRWRDNIPVNLVLISLIVIGGLGFSVLVDIGRWVRQKVRQKIRVTGGRGIVRLSWYSQVVLSTSLFLVVGGWGLLLLTEYIIPGKGLSLKSELLTALFQSVTCRTAGFNSIDIGQMTNVSLLVMMVLMWVGGAPGSTAGGIKVTTFRVLLGFFSAQVRGRRQTVIGRIGVNRESLNRALVLTLYSLSLIGLAVFLLDISETRGMSVVQSRGMLLDITFEVVSALGTTGLSTGLTSSLSVFGKLVLMVLMFVGRLGPLIFLAVVQDMQHEESFFRPEGDLLIG